jgi:MFS transporter, OFA family, oxalate/formate antiporter
MVKRSQSAAVSPPDSAQGGDGYANGADGEKRGAGAVMKSSRFVNRSPVYYGWIILIAAGIGIIMTSPGQTYSVSIFIDHFIEDLGLSRSLVSTLYTIGTLTASFALPVIGGQIDKRGPRMMVGIITVGLALACLYMGTVQNAVMLGVGFVFIRMMGQGSLGMVSINVMNRWWVRKRGMVLSLTGVITGLLGSGTFPSLIHALIARFGWRTSYMLLGLFVAVVMLPIGLIFFRREPEEYGLLPDGTNPEAKIDVQADGGFVEENWTRREALHTWVFWIISLGGASLSMLGTGLQFHMVSIFDDANLSTEAAAAAFMTIAIAASVVRLGAGILADRAPIRYLLSVALLGQTATLLMAPRLQGRTSALVYGIVMGLTSALAMTVSAVVWAKYFGRRHLGAITGVSSLIQVAGSALGPMPMGMARDMLGSYTQALTVLAVLPLILSIVVLFARRPAKPRFARYDCHEGAFETT